MKKISAFLILSVLLVSCQHAKTSETKTADYLSDQTCNAPCFFGIIPGVTPVGQSMTILGKSGLFINCEQHDNTRQGGIKWIQCNNNDVAIFFDSKNIASSVSFRQSNLTVSRVIEKYGLPDSVIVQPSTRPDEPSKSISVLLYNTTLTGFSLDEQDGSDFKISSDLPIVRVAYYSQDGYLGIKDSKLHNWKGYGIYSALP